MKYEPSLTANVEVYCHTSVGDRKKAEYVRTFRDVSAIRAFIMKRFAHEYDPAHFVHFYVIIRQFKVVAGERIKVYGKKHYLIK